jgi:uncharacterized membrane protein YhdT
MAALGERNPVARWQRVSLDGALLALAASGLVWLLAHYGFGAGREEIGLPHWSEAWLMRVHGLAGFAVLLVVGAFLPLHVPRGWRLQPQRGFEITMLTLLGIAIVTAYCLYYFAPDTVRPLLGWVHAIAGCVAGGAVLWHRRRRAPSRG